MLGQLDCECKQTGNFPMLLRDCVVRICFWSHKQLPSPRFQVWCFLWIARDCARWMESGFNDVYVYAEICNTPHQTTRRPMSYMFYADQTNNAHCYYIWDSASRRFLDFKLRDAYQSRPWLCIAEYSTLSRYIYIYMDGDRCGTQLIIQTLYNDVMIWSEIVLFG